MRYDHRVLVRAGTVMVRRLGFRFLRGTRMRLPGESGRVKRLFLLGAGSLLSVASLAANVEVFIGQPTSAGREYLIAGWHFNEAALSPASQLGVSHGIGSLTTDWVAENITDFTGTTVNSFGGDPAGRDLALRNGADLANEGRNLEFTLDLSDFEALAVTYSTQRSSSGFTDQEWWWSVDGEEFNHVATVTAGGSHSLQTIDFASVTALEDVASVYLRLVLRGLPSSPSASGNNRIDNIHFRARAIVGTAGPGSATIMNVTAGDPYFGSDLFAPGQAASVKIAIVGAGNTPIDMVAVALPEGWEGMSAGGIELSGAGFSGATVAVSEGTVTIANGDVTDEAPGAVTFHQLTTPVGDLIADLGRAEFVVETAVAGEQLAEIGHPPVGLVVIPIAMIRPVDSQGVALALDRRVAVSGVATVDSGIFSVTDFSSYLQDETAGVAIDYSPIDDIWKVVVSGYSYTAIGRVTQFRGLTRITLDGNDGLVELGPGQMPEPRIRTIAQLLSEVDDLEGSLVRIERSSKSITSAAWPEPGVNGILTVTDDGDVRVLPLFLNRFTDISVYPEPGYPLDLVGILSQYGDSAAPFNTGYQVLPRAFGDIHPASEARSGFGRWQADRFSIGQMEDAAIGGAGADADGDGLTNLLEYGLGGDPWSSSVDLLPRISAEDGFLAITFLRVKEGDDLIYGVEASSDLVSWEEIWSSVDFPYVSAEGIIQETVTDIASLAGVGSRFLRLVIRQDL